jgi:Transposase domain (DUF772)/Transposase DDE domain
MGMGRRPQERQQEFWIASEALASVPKHVFYDKLNELLDEAGFDAFVEQLCEPFYSGIGRASIPPGRYFRMLFVGYFEELDSQRGIAWRCADSLSLRHFLFLDASEESPDHSSLTRIRERLPLYVHEQVFAFVLEIAHEKKLLSGTQVGVDATTLEANAAMKSIVRRDSGEDWKEYLKRLAEAEGIEIHNDEDLRRFDKQRKKQGKKKVSNEEWTSPVDPDSRVIKLKDGRTHLGYKAEHVVDLKSEYILSADVVHGTDSDSETLVPSLVLAQTNLVRAGSEAEIKEVAADKGYHANQTLLDCQQIGVRTYIPQRETGRRRWTDKPPEMEAAYRNNGRRVKREKGKRLQRIRSELLERSFAHVCETGGARRTWLRGLEKINKRYQIHTAARNLGLLMRDLFGVGKPRVLQDGVESLRLVSFHSRRPIGRCRVLRVRWSPSHRLGTSRPALVAVA